MSTNRVVVTICSVTSPIGNTPGWNSLHEKEKLESAHYKFDGTKGFQSLMLVKFKISIR